MFILELCQALKDQGIHFAVVGGHAVALHGAVRGTVDIDFIIQWNRDQLLKTEQCLNSLGLQSRLPISTDDLLKNKQDYIDNRNLIAWNFYHPQDFYKEVDIIITHDLAEKNTVTIKIGDTDIPLLNKDDLIKMKQLSGREQDLADIAALQALSNE